MRTTVAQPNTQLTIVCLFFLEQQSERKEEFWGKKKISTKKTQVGRSNMLHKKRSLV